MVLMFVLFVLLLMILTVCLCWFDSWCAHLYYVLGSRNQVKVQVMVDALQILLFRVLAYDFYCLLLILRGLVLEAPTCILFCMWRSGKR